MKKRYQNGNGMINMENMKEVKIKNKGGKKWTKLKHQKV